jgi:hypothetical protein
MSHKPANLILRYNVKSKKMDWVKDPNVKLKGIKKKSKPKRKPIKKEDPKKYRIFLGSGKHKDLTALGMLREVNKAKAYYASALKNYTLKNWQEGWWDLCEGGQVDEQGYQKEYLGYCQKAVTEYFTTLIKKERRESKT